MFSFHSFETVHASACRLRIGVRAGAITSPVALAVLAFSFLVSELGIGLT